MLMEWLFHFAGALFVAAAAMTSTRRLRWLVMAGCVVALVWLAWRGGPVSAMIWIGAVGIANGAQLAVMVRRSRTGMMRQEERDLLEHILRVEEPARQKRLLDVMRWRDAAEGEVLIRQGQVEPPLIYVASGTGVIEHDGSRVGQCGKGDFLGEMSMVSGQRASAWVIAAEPMRIAEFDRDALAHLSRSSPEIGAALAAALNQGLAAKVQRMNETARRAET